MLQGIIPKNIIEYIDFFNVDTTTAEKKHILKKMLEQNSSSSCAYCNGLSADTPRFSAAEQLENR